MRQLHGQQNIDRPKSGKSYKNALNSVRWNFMTHEIRPTRRGTRHVPTCWLSLFTMFKAVECWALTIALRQAGYFLRSRKTKCPHHSGTVGLHVYFTHFFVSSIQDRPTCSLQFSQFSSWRNGQQFPMIFTES